MDYFFTVTTDTTAADIIDAIYARLPRRDDGTPDTACGDEIIQYALDVACDTCGAWIDEKISNRPI